MSIINNMYNKKDLYKSIMNNVSKQVKFALNESLLKKSFKSLLESMSVPPAIDQIFWDKDETFIIFGTDGKYYYMYPTYGDAYSIHTKGDDYLLTLCDKVNQSFQNHGIRGKAIIYNDDIIIDTNDDQYNDDIKTWFSKKGLYLKSEDEDSMRFIYPKYDNSYDENKINGELQGFIDVTYKVSRFFKNMDWDGPKSCSRKALAYLQDNFSDITESYKRRYKKYLNESSTLFYGQWKVNAPQTQYLEPLIDGDISSKKHDMLVWSDGKNLVKLILNKDNNDYEMGIYDSNNPDKEIKHIGEVKSGKDAITKWGSAK